VSGCHDGVTSGLESVPNSYGPQWTFADVFLHFIDASAVTVRRPRIPVDGIHLTTDQKVGSSNLFGRAQYRYQSSAKPRPLDVATPATIVMINCQGNR
jgi:hypothetical protein